LAALGVSAAITRVLSATWQRCRVHFMRNALAYVPKGQNTVVAAAIRQVFLQPDHAAATQVWRQVADQLRTRWPKLGTCMDEAEHDVLAYMTFPEQHRVKLHSTNPLERLNKEVKRRADVVGMLASPPFGSPTRTASSASSAPSCSSKTTNTSSSTATCRSKAWQRSPHPPSRRLSRYRLHPKPPENAARWPQPNLHHIDGHDPGIVAGITSE
jgi:transposase-like protein